MEFYAKFWVEAEPKLGLCEIGFGALRYMIKIDIKARRPIKIIVLSPP